MLWLKVIRINRDDQIKEVGMFRACSMNWKEEKYIA
jgi:hypothetical protein